MATDKRPFFIECLGGRRGVGYWIQYAGLEQLSVAWPDAPATRHTSGDVQRYGFKLRPIGEVGEQAGADTNIPETESDRDVHQGEEGLEQVVPSPADTPDSSPSVARTWQARSSEAEAIRAFFLEHGTELSNSEVIEALDQQGYQVRSSQVQRERKKQLASSE